MRLKFILTIIQLSILSQLIIDKDMHSFIVFATVIFYRFIHCAQLIHFFFFSLLPVVFPASGPQEVFL